MAEKTVSVRLRVIHDQYLQAMRESGRGTEDAAKRAATAWGKVGHETAKLGDSLTRNVTLPIVALGGVAVKMAADFDSVFTKMMTTAGLAADEVQGLKDSVLSLSTETGRGPQELAEALLLIRSSGFAGAEAMAVLETSAKGAAAGMGETREIANALTNVIAGYGAGNITAAEAMDILVASVQEGKAEAAEMAPQFGRLVPIAAELEIGFGDVAGALAFLTRATGDASQSSTALQGIFSKLLRPSQQGAEALERVGLSADGLRQMLAEKGLLGTLESLREHLGDTGFQVLFDDVQALNGALQLTGPGLEDARDVIERVNDSAGKADNAFGKWAESMGADNAQAFAKFQVAMIQAGETLAPLASGLLGFAGDIVAEFSLLPDAGQKVILALVGIAAATGPLLSAGGRVVSMISTMGKLSPVLGGIGVAMVPLTIIGLGLAHMWAQNAQDAAEARQQVDELTEALKREAQGVETASAEVLASKLAMSDLGSALRDGGADMAVFVDAIQSGSDEIERLAELAAPGLGTSTEALRTSIRGLADDGSVLGRELDRLAESGDLSEGELRGLLIGLDELSGSFADAEEATANQEHATESLGEELGTTTAEVEAATAALDEYLKTLKATFDPLFGMVDALQQQQTAQADLRLRAVELDEAIRTYGDGSVEAQAAQQALTEAQNTAAGSVIDLHAAAVTLRSEMENNGLTAEAATLQFVSFATQMGFTEAEALAMALMFGFATGEADRLGATDPSIDVSTSGTAEAIAALDAIQARIDGIFARTIALPPVFGGPRLPQKRQHGGRAWAGEAYIVGEKHAELFVPDQDGMVLPDAAAYLAPSRSVIPAVGAGGSATNVTNVYLTVDRPIVADGRQFQRMVTDAVNKAKRTGSGINV